MKKEHKGCLILISGMFFASIGLYIGLKFDFPFIRVFSQLSIGMFGAYIGNKYFNDKEKNPNERFWLIVFLITLLASAILAWCIEGKIW